jgi:acyl-CoA synthetase (AMP-forming)/AMP-acid ligase II
LALIAGERRRITAPRLGSWANRDAQALAAVGVEHGRRCGDAAEHARSCSACGTDRAGGALVVPISYRAVTAEVSYLVSDSGAGVLVYDDKAVVEPALAALGTCAPRGTSTTPTCGQPTTVLPPTSSSAPRSSP